MKHRQNGVWETVKPEGRGYFVMPWYLSRR
jgi:hypothetical protein